MKQMMWLTLAMFSFAFNLGCERNASNKSRITLALPSELQERIEKSQVSTYTALKLHHVALQITAPDIVNPIRVILDSQGDNVALPSTIEVEIPPGDNRLVQLIAAYAADESDSPWIYYGDVTQSLKKSIENITLPVYKLGGAGVTTMSRITGRFLTSTNAGPTGVLEMVYRPAGKPSMPVDKKPIYAGWFETSSFADVPVDYIITANNGSTYTLGSQLTSSSFATSERVVRFSTPNAFESFWSYTSGAMGFKYREREDFIVGFFANDPALIASKYICVTSQTDLNGGTLHSERALNSAFFYSARPFKHFYHGTTPTYSPTEVTIVGGKRIASCGTLNYAQEFIDYLWFLPGVYSGQSTREDFQESLGMNEGFISSLGLEPSQGTTNRYPGRDVYLNGEMYKTFNVLPGLENVVDKVMVYKNPAGTYMGGEDRCDHIDTSFWQPVGTFPAEFSGNKLLFKMSQFPVVNQSYAICLTSMGKPLGRLMFAYPMSTVWAPPETVSLAYPGVIPPQPGQCVRMVAYASRTSGSAMMYPLSTPISVSIAASISGTPTAKLYPDATCSGTPQTSQTVVIPAGEVNAAFFYKVTSSTTLTLGITGNSASLTNGSDIDVAVSDFPTETPTGFIIETNSNDRQPFTNAQIFEYGCFPFRARAMNSSNTNVSFTGEVTMSFENLAGNTASLPTGFNFYDTCASPTPLSSLSFSSQSAKSFVIKAAGNVPVNKKLKLTYGGASGIININQTPIAHSLAFSPASSAGHFDILTYQCTAVTVKIRDINGADQVATENIPVNLYTSHSDIEFFASSSCASAPISSTQIASGTTSSSVFVRTFFTGAGQNLHASSPLVSNQGFINLNPLASNMTVTPSITTTAPNSSLLVQITGGSAPYTTTILSNVSSADTPMRGGNTFQFNMTVGATTGPATVSVTDSSGQTQVVTVTVTP
ncbi:hypothetical protein AZI86_00155 [Bdellovibrio bacteriovorus]|uniref:Hemagglutinin/hemolysin-related protein n=1 Tax=Bdellovibrio bacteriovorus TaxID=959 RepID=A0A150WMJ3_BDEBC|nr:hypothetical protein [Bdellovibrio bacteriovorus]KYG65527.1 hypothetical protein AZI86_00155 [Bdellovibrio bacteriovorus]